MTCAGDKTTIEGYRIIDVLTFFAYQPQDGCTVCREKLLIYENRQGLASLLFGVKDVEI